MFLDNLYSVPENFGEAFSRLVKKEVGKEADQNASPISLAAIALDIARDRYPTLDAELYLAKIAEWGDELGGEIARRYGVGSSEKILESIELINARLFSDLKFSGNIDDYFDPKNSYLNEVVERKLGIPITLSILYQSVAARSGVVLEGVSLPSHFMLRCHAGGSLFFVDAFNGGKIYDVVAAERVVAQAARRPVILDSSHTKPASLETMALRLLMNLKIIYVRSKDFSAAWPVLKRIAYLRPDSPEDQRDYGVVAYYLRQYNEAIRPMSFYLKHRPDGKDAENVRYMVEKSKAALGPMH